ncbi:hypothetical protein P3578_24365, partial [Vibrio parahaemolyticus]|nr:hypothetical protein [Vibrio parahaemolyticus]
KMAAAAPRNVMERSNQNCLVRLINTYTASPYFVLQTPFQLSNVATGLIYSLMVSSFSYLLPFLIGASQSTMSKSGEILTLQWVCIARNAVS